MLKTIFKKDEAGKNSLIREFEGVSGKKYTISGVNDGLNIVRLTWLRKLAVEVGSGLSFDEIYKALNDAQNKVRDLLIGKMDLTEYVMLLEEKKDALVLISEKRFDTAFYYCSLFINYEGEDVTEWSFESANAKIEDWKEYDANDFLALALNTLNGYSALYSQQLAQQAKRIERENRKKRFSDAGGSTKMAAAGKI